MPSWLDPQSLDLAFNWRTFPSQFNSETVFRVTQSGVQVPTGSLLIGIAYGNSGFHTIDRLTLASAEPRLVVYPYDRVLYNLGFRFRTLACRYLGTRPLPPTPWSITLEALEGGLNAMPLFSTDSSQTLTTAAAATTEVTASTTSVALLPVNANRKGCTIHNTSNDFLYIDFDSAVTNTAYAVRIAANGYYELPFGFTGEVSGAWAKANGKAQIREFT
jgi:hypothetical protein